MISKHPGDELLLDYASGALPEAAALAVACHVSRCPACRNEVARLESVGGAAVHEISPEAMPADSLDAALARLDEEPADAPAPPAETGDPSLPYPLRRYLPQGLSALNWRKRRDIVETAALDVSPGGYITRLMRIRPGKAVPDHSHRGNEYTFVLEGGYSDGSDRFGPGDFQAADQSVDHYPVASAEGCLCLVVLDAPMRLTGTIGRLIDPFTRL